VVTETLRAPRVEDAVHAARLMSEHWPEPVGEDRVLRAWTSPRVTLEHDARIGPDSYALVEGLDEGRVMLEVYGQPSPEVLEWAEARAGGKGRRWLCGAWASNEPLQRALEGRGYELVRHSHRMEIDLTEPPMAPEWPAELTLRTFCEGDERTFYDVQQEVFDDAWEPVRVPFEEWAHWLLQPPIFVPELWFLAFEGDKPAGFAICHPHPESDGLGWVGILGVRRPWRRRGLGRALLLHAFGEFRARGLLRAGLGVDAESLTGAHRLYESAGMHVSAHYVIYEKSGIYEKSA
jgi:GNAT superfamily N-acetyltransferase